MSTSRPRKAFKVDTRVTPWTNADGTENDVVRLFAGTRSIAVDFTELPALIEQLEKLHHGQVTAESYTDRLFTKGDT